MGASGPWHLALRRWGGGGGLDSWAVQPNHGRGRFSNMSGLCLDPDLDPDLDADLDPDLDSEHREHAE